MTLDTLDTLDTKRLRELAAKATLRVWYLGVAGSCNLVSYNGDDIVGIAIVGRNENAAYIAALHNAAPELLALAERAQATEARLENVTRLLAECGELFWNQFTPDATDEMNQAVSDARAFLAARKGG